MAREPQYPDDVPVGEPAAPPSGASEAAELAAAAKAADPRRARNLVAGAAIGIGSAALVAALLYANRSRRGGDS
jgi:hypothetical protein